MCWQLWELQVSAVDLVSLRSHGCTWKNPCTAEQLQKGLFIDLEWLPFDSKKISETKTKSINIVSCAALICKS